MKNIVTDMAKSNNNLSEFTDFLNEIGGRITDDTWHAMKIHLHSISYLH